ncbi:MAG TPA: UDP-3-O-(3-hydroxymyristoyl)glucosamine N-acyltransferase, partial [Candidatus Cloacimonas sp.]|nr:UDP-3-O-(3-hydroxymyristoyl)glucosamine N-acyltransferase [Candidatus Cloacimonas sp.]
PTAIVAEDVRFEGEVAIGANVVIGSGCTLGKGVIIAAGCSIGKNVTIGKGTKLFANVCIYDDCVIGRDCILHSGVVIGADGFGFMLIEGKQQKIPQVGNVVISDNVEIGANSCIDRATLGSTIIGRGTKIDNLVQVGHNCIIGEHSILCSQVGLAGSTVIGDYVYLAGQVGIADHLQIGNRAMVGAQSGVSGNIPEDGRYFGYPAMDANLTKRIMAIQKNLPDMYHFYLKAKKNESDNGEK